MNKIIIILIFVLVTPFLSTAKPVSSISELLEATKKIKVEYAELESSQKSQEEHSIFENCKKRCKAHFNREDISEKWVLECYYEAKPKFK